jgi:hypothetical protein
LSIERKDVRGKLHPDIHAQLTAIAEIDGRDMGEIVEELVCKYVKARVHDATLLADRIARLGITGNNRESQGVTGNAPKGAPR